MGRKSQKLTEKQRLVMDLYYKQNMTQKDIADRLQISQQAVSKLVKKIRKKTGVRKKRTGGCISGGAVGKKGLYPQPSFPVEKKEAWRVENLHCIVDLYHIYPRYHKKRLERGNSSVPHKHFRIWLYKGKVRVQQRKNVYFRSIDKYKAVQLAEESFTQFLNYAADTYGFEYEKERRISIKQVNIDIAREGSKLGEEYAEQSGEKYLRVKDRTGKVCFVIDQSTPNEHEYIGRNSFENSENLEPYIQDLLFNAPLTNSQLTARITDVVGAIEKIEKVLQKLT